MAGPMPGLLALMEELYGRINKERLFGGGVRGAATRGLLGADAPENATPAEMEAYRNIANASMALAAGPVAATRAIKGAKTLKNAPQAQAMETARQNAVKMLGLPESNTAMDRAKAMGFRAERFHETSAPNLEKIGREGFDPRRAVAAASDEETPYGVFTKESGRSIGLAKEGEVQMPLLVRTNEGTPSFMAFRDRADLTSRLRAFNPEIANLQAATRMDDAERARQIDALGEMLGTRAKPNTSGFTDAEIWKQIDALASGNTEMAAKAKDLITKEFLRRGVDTVMLGKDAGSLGRSVETVISLNPANIRSRFAAFDPARIDEKDLLASLAAMGITLPLTMGLLSEQTD